MRKGILLFILFSMLYGGKPPIFNDILYFRNGEELNCQVLWVKKDKVKVKAKVNGKVKKITFSRDSIASIDLGKIRYGDEWLTVEDIEDTLLKRIVYQEISTPVKLPANYVNLFLRYDLKVNKDSSYTLKVRIIRKILTKSGESVGGNIRFWYPDFAIARVLFARSIVPDSSGKIVHIRDNAIEDAHMFSSYPEYGHLKSLKMAVPEAKVGNILDVCFEIDYPPFKFPENPFYFVFPLGEFEPTKQAIVKFVFPSRMQFLFDQKDVNVPKYTDDGHVKEIVWKLNGHDGIKRERYMPPYKEFIPVVFIGANLTWKQMAEVIRKQIFKMDTEEMPIENIDPVHTFVEIQNNIEYVNAPFAASGFKFMGLKKLLKNGYGNSFDKAVYLYRILKDNGVKVRLGFVLPNTEQSSAKVPGMFSTFDGYFLSSRKPGDGEFKGAFLIVNDSLYLFPEKRYTPVNYIPYNYQGAMYLDIGTGKIEALPEVSAEDEAVIIERKGVVKGRDLYITETRTYKGRAEMVQRAWSQFKDRQIRQFKEMELARIWGNANLIDFSHTPFDSVHQVYAETLTYVVKGFIKEGNRTYMFNIPSMFNNDSLFSPARNYEVYFKTPALYKASTIIKFRKPLKALYLPTGGQIEKGASYYYSYAIFQKSRAIKVEESFRRATPRISRREVMGYLKALYLPVNYNSIWYILRK